MQNERAFNTENKNRDDNFNFYNMSIHQCGAARCTLKQNPSSKLDFDKGSYEGVF